MIIKVRLTDSQYDKLQTASPQCPIVALCGQHSTCDYHCLMIHEYAKTNTPQAYRELIQKARQKSMAILVASVEKILPPTFQVDDLKDSGVPHAMIDVDQHGHLKGNLIDHNGTTNPINCFAIIGNQITFYHDQTSSENIPSHAKRNAQCFGDKTINILRELTIGVVGISGTGSVVVEQLARLGVGKLLLIEPKVIEHHNLNRILNSGKEDVGQPKTEIAATAIKQMGLGTEVLTISDNLVTRDAIQAISECDVVFGCMDTAEGRLVLNRVSSFYTIPYFDVGIRLDADGKGGISQIIGSVHILTPGGSSMLSRRAITEEQIRFDAHRRQSPNESLDKLQDNYIKGVAVDSPAVISFNMFYASLVVIEFLNRIHCFRELGGTSADWICVNLSEDQIIQIPMNWDEKPCPALAKYVGRGDMEPLLDRPELSKREVSLC